MILKNARVISPIDKLDDILDIRIKDGIIIEISKNITNKDEKVHDFSNKIIIPGLVEIHCHLREPGFEYKETIESGTNSAIAGGYTAICSMANTNPIVDNSQTINFILNKSKTDGEDIIFPVSAITKELKGEECVDFEANSKAGAITFSDDGKPLENMKLFKQALQSGKLIISHAEDSTLLTEPESEAISVARELELLRAVGGRLHFAHISTKRALELIRQAKKDGLNVTCETAPHYFTFTKENETKDGRFKMNPPLRTKEDLNAIVEALKDGTIDCIATDHAPHSLEEKQKTFADAPFGVIGFETAFGASLKLCENEHISLNQLIEKISTNPAKILGLKNQGEIKINNLANLAIFDIDGTYMVNEKKFVSKCKISPFNGMIFSAKHVATIVNGKLIKIGA